MTHRRVPLRLLRDVPAFMRVMISFWPQMILVILNGHRAAPGKKIRQSVYAEFAILLAHAEAGPAFTLWRQAYRRLGWNPRGVALTLVAAAEDRGDTIARCRAYSRPYREMDA